MGVRPPLPAPILARICLIFQMIAAIDIAACFGPFRLACAASYEFRYSAHLFSFQDFVFVRGRLYLGRFSLFVPDYGMRGGLGIRSSSSIAQVCSFALGVRGCGSLPKSPHSCVNCGQIGETRFRMHVGPNCDVSHTSRRALAILHQLRYLAQCPDCRTHIRPWQERFNQLQTLVKDGQSQVFPGVPKWLVFPGDPGVPDSLAPVRNNFVPCFGVARTPSFASASIPNWVCKLTGTPVQTSIRLGYARKRAEGMAQSA